MRRVPALPAVAAAVCLVIALVLGPPAAPAPAQPASNAPASNAPASVVVGYYASWSAARRPPSSLPATLVTHVVFAFAGVRPSGECAFVSARDVAVAGELVAWRRRNPSVRVLLGLGGWDQSAGFSSAAATPQARARFAASCVRLARDNGFDGLDVDWEYPANGRVGGLFADRANLPLLLAAVRAEQRPGELLTVATPAGRELLAAYDLPAVAAQVDWFHVMTYDYAGSWSDRTGHDAPLGLSDATWPFSVEGTVAAYREAGVAPAQLVVGVPFFGRAFADVDLGAAPASGPSPPASNVPGAGSAFGRMPSWAPSGAIDWRNLASRVRSPSWRRTWDEAARVPSLVNDQERVFVSYDDPESVAAKAAYARDAGLRGAMAWELTGDDDAWSLLRSLAGVLRP